MRFQRETSPPVQTPGEGPLPFILPFSPSATFVFCQAKGKDVSPRTVVSSSNRCGDLWEPIVVTRLGKLQQSQKDSVFLTLRFHVLL